MLQNARSFQIKLLSLLLLIMLAANLAAGPTPIAHAAANWYVQAGGSDANTCQALSSPCATVGGAIGKATAGDTISIAAGSYQENLTIGKSITLAGSGPGATALNGGGVASVVSILPSATVAISGVTILNGNTTGNGGGINNQGSLTLSNSVLRNNHAFFGNAINTTGPLTIADSTIANNSPAAGTNGSGAIYGDAAIAIDRSIFSGNTAGGGGALNVGGIVTIRASTFTGNSATTNDGGAIFARGGTMLIENSTISGNSAFATGGGLVTSAAVTATVTVTINNSTFANNSARPGGGGNISVFMGSLTLHNMIIANPAAGGNCRSTIPSSISDGGNNIQFGDTSCGSSIPPLDPLLGPLQNNGGPTFTQALLPGSPAIDAGNNATCLPTDQRGVARPQGSACDIGAYERGPRTLYVAPAGSDTANCVAAASACATIGGAIGKAAAGDTISIAAGNYQENLVLTKSLTLQGQDQDTTIIDGGGAGQTVSIGSASAITLTGVTITGGSSISGAGIYNAGRLNLYNSIISHNVSSGNGGGLFNEYTGTALIVDSTIISNSAQYGAALYNNTDFAITSGLSGRLTVVRSTISGNNATIASSGLESWGDTTIRNSTFAENRAAGSGSAIGVSGGSAAILNSTFVGNISTGGGAGIWGSATLTNSIVANNIPSNCNSALTNGGNNLQFPSASCGAISVADPQLGPLQDNGGTTETMAPRIGSPAIDAGNPATCTAVDQRGVKRPQGAICDIGAIETAPLPTSATDAGESEPNNVIDQANLLVIDEAGHAARTGTITATTDMDIYTFSAQPGATVAISLTNLPADYDLALLADPRDTIPISDSIDLSGIADNSRSDASGELDALGTTGAAERINAIGQLAIGQLAIGQLAIGQLAIGQLAIGQLAISTLLNGASANQGTQDETISSFLPRGGQYYVMVYSAAGAFDPTRAYSLSMNLQDSGMAKPTLKARPIGALTATPDPLVRTIYLYNSARMAARYPQQTQQAGQLTSFFAPGSSLLALTDARGVGIDLGGQTGGALLSANDQAALTNLYAAWDGSDKNRRNPLWANELAQQIWYVLDRAMTSYYTGTTDIVLVGGDDIIPFYRVPDEVPLATENTYYDTLKAKGAIANDSPLAGSLFYHFIQTDNFYADRSPTPWRGRALYIPDMGIGRLVEQPSEIVSYLHGYLNPSQSGFDPSRFVVDASGSDGAALVTGYDFMSDQADAISSTLKTYGYNLGGSLGKSPTLDTLISRTVSDTWGVDNLTSKWFSDQLPSLTSTYSGPHTKYQLMSINGHFSHYDATPANAAAGVFSATRLLTPTALTDADLFFRPSSGASTSLLYSVGCHSGLNVPADTISGATPALTSAYQADFPEAVLKQGGNWIGNTGYGYGDDKMIGYSERLALLFTKQIGYNRSALDLPYAGAPVGDSLTRAKRGYLLSNGPGGFSVYDEKVIEEMTLYGLPFIRVKVPSPIKPPDTTPLAIPQAVLSTLSDKNPIFTRTITVTNDFSFDSQNVPQTSSTIEDSFRSGTIRITSEDQTSQGRPVLPALTYDITLQPSAPGGDMPIPRGVRMRSATTLPDLAYDPHVTTPITDQIYPQQQNDPALRARQIWLPDLPYNVQRTSQENATRTDTLTDQLLVSSAQFYANNGENGMLRRFSKMVFEVSYIEPQIASATVLDQDSSPLLSDIQITPMIAASAIGSQAADQLVRFSAVVTDTNDGELRLISATYTSDGISWQRVQLEQRSATGPYEATVSTPAGGEISAFFEALDSAGNVTVEAFDSAVKVTTMYLPVSTFSRPQPPDLIGSFRLVPNKLAFAAGEPVRIEATITNTGDVAAAPFWVDFYINPSSPPATNSSWNMLCGMKPCFGLTWAVAGGLGAGESITLTSTPGQFAAPYSIWPGYFAQGTADLYLYVDSWNPPVAGGAVAESNEGNNRAELHGLVVSGPNPPLLSLQSAERVLVRPALPGR